MARMTSAMTICAAGRASRKPPSAPRRDTTKPAAVSLRRICSRNAPGTPKRSLISCRLHQASPRSPMASSARQPYSLAAVVRIGEDSDVC